jgi:ATP-dependent HslUV protease ATP-binding subunit HslU
MQQMTPKQIVAELDKYIVGQGDAKRAVAIAIRNRWRRQQLPDTIRQDVWPKNILMMGPTGVGKTEIARRMASLSGAPFIKVEATKFTEVGYHGRDVDSMVRDLLDAALNLVRNEMVEAVKTEAESQVEERLLDLLLPSSQSAYYSDPEAEEKRKATRDKLRGQLKAGDFEERMVEMTIEQRGTAAGVLGQAAMEMEPEFQNMIEKMLPTSRETKRMTVATARRVLLSQEAEKLMDKGKLTTEAIARAEESGIIFLDEIDKIAGTEKSDGPDVSRQGVQRDLLPIVEGSTITTRHGPVRTDHILFIAAGAFHHSKPSDLMPELQGRFPIRVELQDLTRDDFIRILKEPKNALTRQQAELLKTEGITIEFTDDGIEAIAQIAYDTNRKQQNIGARRLYTIMERVFESISFEAPDLDNKYFRINGPYVRQRIAELEKGEGRKGWFL